MSDQWLGEYHASRAHPIRTGKDVATGSAATARGDEGAAAGRAGHAPRARWTSKCGGWKSPNKALEEAVAGERVIAKVLAEAAV